MLPEIDALRVKALQERTGAGMMNCKIALVEAGGGIDAAVRLLQKRRLLPAAIERRPTPEGFACDRVGKDAANDARVAEAATAAIRSQREEARMTRVRVAVVNHSGYGHTERLANTVARGATAVQASESFAWMSVGGRYEAAARARLRCSLAGLRPCYEPISSKA